MKTLVLLFLTATLVASTTPGFAADISQQPRMTSAPRFIAHGTPLTARETATLIQRPVFNRISLDAGGESSEAHAADVALVILLVAALGAVVYALVVQSQQTARYFF